MKCLKDVASLLELVELRKRYVELGNRDTSIVPDVLSSDGPSAGSMKKTTAFTKKLRSGMIHSQLDSIISDLSDLKLDKYLSEVVNAIVESKIKTSKDLNACVKVGCLLHEKHPEFKRLITESILKTIECPNSAYASSTNVTNNLNTTQQKKEKEASRLMRQRVTLRLLMEFYLAGIITDSQKELFIPKALRAICLDEKKFLTNSSVIITFAKNYGHLFFNVPDESSENVVSYEELLPYIELIISPSLRESVCKILKTHYTWTENALEIGQNLIKQTGISNYEYYIAMGEVTCERQNQYQKIYSDYEKILEVAKQLSKYLGFDEPEGILCQTIAPGIGITQDKSFNLFYDKQTPVFVWEDENLKMFYEDLVDLSSEPQSSPVPTFTTSTNLNENENKEASKTDIPLCREPESNESLPQKSRIDQLIDKLQYMVTAEDVDIVAIEFMTQNTKSTRNKLIKALLSVPRNRSDLLPLYARLIATLNRVIPYIGSEVASSLKNYFSKYIKAKSKGFIGDKMKNLMYMGELVKFRIIPGHVALHCINMLLDDFRLFNIDLLCIFLETCGNFLHKMPGTTSSRMPAILEILKKKKTEKNINHRQAIMIENVYYNCCPPGQTSNERRKDDSTRLYTKNIFLATLCRGKVEKAIRQLRKFNWEDPKVVRCIKTCLLNVREIKYTDMGLLAYIMHELMKYYPGFVIEVIDGLFEQVEVGLEQNLYSHNQQRVSAVKLLVELYNYKMIQGCEIFNILYNILCYGHIDNLPRYMLSVPLDHSNDFFRIRLCCTILSTCGVYFKTGKAAKRMEFFMTFLQMYIHSKNTCPTDIGSIVEEILDSYCPQLGKFGSYVEAGEHLLELKDEDTDDICPQISKLSNQIAKELERLKNETKNIENSENLKVFNDDNELPGSNDSVIIQGDQDRLYVELNVNEKYSEKDYDTENDECDEFDREYEKLVCGRDKFTFNDNSPTPETPLRLLPIDSSKSLSRSKNRESMKTKGKLTFLILDKNAEKRKSRTLLFPKEGLLALASSPSIKPSENDEKEQLDLSTSRGERCCSSKNGGDVEKRLTHTPLCAHFTQPGSSKNKKVSRTSKYYPEFLK